MAGTKGTMGIRKWIAACVMAAALGFVARADIAVLDSPPFPVDTRSSAGVAMGNSAAFVLNTRGDTRGGSADSGTFALDTRGGMGLTGAALSDTFRLDTRDARTASIAISGPATVVGGNAAAYACTATDANGVTSDISGACTWSLVGTVPAGVSLSGPSLQTAPVTGSQNVTLRATYRAAAGQLVATLAVSITEGGMDAAIKNARAVSTGVNAWALSANAYAYGRYGDVTARWTLDGVPLTGVTSPTLSAYPISGTAKTRILDVELTDTHSRTATAVATVAFNKPIAPREPPIQYPVGDPVGGRMLNSDEGSFSFVSANKTNGLLIITHGIWSSGTQEWVKQLTDDANFRIFFEKKSPPNVAILNWQDGADPDQLEETVDFWKQHLLVANPALVASSLAFSTMAEVLAVHDAAIQQGGALADWVRTEVLAGHIDPTAPLQLIGHSAGGFVVTECAFQLKDRSAYSGLVQVTTLDTPYYHAADAKAHFLSLNAPAANHVERYYYRTPTGLGWFSPALAFVDSGPGIHERGLWKWNVILAHSWVHEWYDKETTAFYGKEQDGFFYSPFLDNGFHKKAVSHMARIVKVPYVPMGTTEAPLDGFETFGAVAQTDGVFQVVEEANAGLFKDVSWPAGAQSVTFHYRFTSPGDGDYLVVYGNTNGLSLYLGSDLPLSRDGFVLGEAPVDMFAGTTNRLTFMLVSRGETNAALEIKDIQLAISDDPDGDGLEAAAESEQGTNPLRADTDGDGLSDFEEVNTTFTDPTKADTDGDGVGDLEEITAGTDPRDATSAFTMGAVTASPSGGVVVSWRGVAGKSYSVHRTTDLSSPAYETVATGVPGVAPITTVEDSTGLASAFYWVELEP